MEMDKQEMLEAMLGDLELCEKSLNDYLETKRLAFPRFCESKHDDDDDDDEFGIQKRETVYQKR